MGYSPGNKISQDQAMELAIDIAERGRGFVLPNPTVGCVIVDNRHRFLSAGAHLNYGGHHAEIEAINSVSDQSLLKGATLYVTLEPCSHRGKTPPCVDSIIEKGISKVIYGMEDPNPRVSGRGVAELMDCDIEVGHFQTYQQKCENLVRDYLHLLNSELPYVVLKVASSLDGKIATEGGESKWITGPETRSFARTLRGFSCATMVGAGTFLSDDPLLDFRETDFENRKKNKVVILDPRGKGASFFPKSRIAKVHALEDIFVITRKNYFADWGKAGVRLLPFSSKKEAWVKNLQNLRSFGISSLFVEGGSFAISQLLKHRLLNRFYCFVAPKILGEGLDWSKGFKIERLHESIQMGDFKTQAVGNDLLITSEFLG